MEVWVEMKIRKAWRMQGIGEKPRWVLVGDIVKQDNFQVGLNNGYKFNVENMKEYY